MALSQCTALMGDVPQGQPWGRWGGRGFRVAPRQPPPGILCLTHTNTQSVLYRHSPSFTEYTNNYRKEMNGEVWILVEVQRVLCGRFFSILFIYIISWPFFLVYYGGRWGSLGETDEGDR